MTLTDNALTTELEILEELEFREEQQCTWAEIDGCEHPARVYVKRKTPCPCFPNGRVFPACRSWAVSHQPKTIGMTACCGTLIFRDAYIELGPIHP